jgi:C-terminal processing protease CtpA/Prc
MVRKTDDGYQFRSRRRLQTWKPQRDAFSGQVYVLINGNSFSVTSEFASVAHFHKRATFIGQETGGGYYGDNSGVFAMVKLPHSGLELGIPLVAYYSAVQGYPYPDRGIIPDYTVVPTVEEVLKGHDRALQTALDLIGSQGEPAAAR